MPPTRPLKKNGESSSPCKVNITTNKANLANEVTLEKEATLSIRMIYP